MANTRRRCSECRRTFTPEPTAGMRQKVCGVTCRAVRDRKLARGRRRAELVEHREDERERQRLHRAKGSGRGEGRPPCHAPPSASKVQEVRGKVALFVDRALAQSRASLLRDLAEIMSEKPNFLVDTG